MKTFASNARAGLAGLALVTVTNVVAQAPQLLLGHCPSTSDGPEM